MPLRLTVVKVSLLPTTPAVIFWLWLVILPVRMDRMCPEGCNCDPKANKVRCHYVPLNKIPFIFPRNVQELIFINNNITNLENDAFISRGLTELKRLEITRCELETIEVGAFNGLTKLNYLKLVQNYLSEILPRTFEGMSSLISLVLRNNIIAYLDVNIFSGLINLFRIDLSGNNLQYLQPDTFVALPKLRILNISHNLELQIPTDSHFISSHSLNYLGISKCSVMSLSAETFANVTALYVLDLSYNNLTTVDINILKELPKLSDLYLYGNPLQCDCQLQKVWRWCQDHNIRYRRLGPVCDTPSEVQGKYWGVLNTGQCLNDTLYFYEEGGNTSLSYNAADDSNFSESGLSSLELFSLFLGGLLYIFGTAGNVVIIIIIISNKDMRTVPNMYILNLAVSDIIYCTANFALHCIHTAFVGLCYSRVTFFILFFFAQLFPGVSIYSIAVLSIQRYRVTVNPFHVRISSQSTRLNTLATICGVWVVAAFFATPSNALFFINAEFSWILTYVKHVVIFVLIVYCLIPLCVIAFTYTMIARHLLKCAYPSFESTRNSRMKRCIISETILLGLTLAFLISNVPVQALYTYYVFTIDQQHNQGFILHDRAVGIYYLSLVGLIWLLLYPCLNPVALFCTSRAFRRKLKRYLTCLCKANSSITDFELTRRN